MVWILVWIFFTAILASVVRDACIVACVVVNTLHSVNDVITVHVLGRVTISRQINHVGNQPPRSTQPGRPSVGRLNEYQR